jgi:hypothetical protein
MMKREEDVMFVKEMGSYIWGTARGDQPDIPIEVRRNIGSDRRKLLRRSKCAYCIENNLYRLLLAKRLREKRVLNLTGSAKLGDRGLACIIFSSL